MTMCYSLLQRRFAMSVFFIVQSIFSVVTSLVPLGLTVYHEFKEVLPNKNFVGYDSLRRHRRVWR